MDRRGFMKAGAAGMALVALRQGFATAAGAAPVVVGPGPYGPLSAADSLGLQLPAGFTARVVARSGQLVSGTLYAWHSAPDGGACFARPNGGWVYASNSETISLLGGGASALAFDPDGSIAGAHRILSGTNINCAGGPTPWGTWLSCEEIAWGRVWECNPQRPGQGTARSALGRFNHEAVAVDPVHGHLYLTEDESDGRLYRFRPNAYPNLGSGTLEVARVDGNQVSWIGPVSQTAWQSSSNRPAGSTAFDGGEGCWYDRGKIYFTTKGGDSKVWALDTASQTIELIYSTTVTPGGPLRGVDNVTVSAAGDIYVAEDGDNMELVMLSREGEVTPFLRLNGQDDSEITGPAFNPAGNRLYFSSQRGTSGNSIGLNGITYEVTGPFRA